MNECGAALSGRVGELWTPQPSNSVTIQWRAGDNMLMNSVTGRTLARLFEEGVGVGVK